MAAAVDAAHASGDTLQADAFKRLYPQQYFERFVREGIRPDGRLLAVCRPATVAAHAAGQAAGSALVKLGATSVMAGVRLEVMVPPASRPDAGVLAVSAELTPLTGAAAGDRARRAAAADAAAAFVAAALTGDPRGDGASAGNLSPAAPTGAAPARGALDLRQLCISPGQAVWVLYLDLYVLEADGGVWDAALMAAAAALADTRLPAVRLTDAGNVERQEGGAPPEPGGGGSGPPAGRLRLAFTPYSLTCGLHQGHLLADPTAEEAALPGGTVTSVVDEEGGLLGVHVPGSGVPVTPAALRRCIDLARARARELHPQLQQALQAAAAAQAGAAG